MNKAVSGINPNNRATSGQLLKPKTMQSKPAHRLSPDTKPKSVQRVITAQKTQPNAPAIYRPNPQRDAPLIVGRPMPTAKPIMQLKAASGFGAKERSAPATCHSHLRNAMNQPIQPLLHSLAFKYKDAKKDTIEQGDARLRKENPAAYRDAPINQLKKDEDLYLHGHGSSKRFGKMNAPELAAYLSTAGLPAHAGRIYLLGCNTAGYSGALQEILNKKPYSYKVLVQGTPGAEWVPRNGMAYFAATPQSADAFRKTRDLGHLTLLNTPALRITTFDELTAPAAAWQEDNAIANCPLCHQAFGAFRWRHHCRKCGKVVCDACSQARQQVGSPAVRPGSVPEKGALRVCNKCK